VSWGHVTGNHIAGCNTSAGSFDAISIVSNSTGPTGRPVYVTGNLIVKGGSSGGTVRNGIRINSGVSGAHVVGNIVQTTAYSSSPVSDVGTSSVIRSIDGPWPATQITFAPAGNLSSTNVQAALAELDSEKLATTAVLDTISNVSAPSPSDGQVLTYDATSATWVAETPVAALPIAGGTMTGNIVLDDGVDIEVGDTAGSVIGSAFSALAFFGATPTSQPLPIADPTGGTTIDAEARTAIIEIRDALVALGLIQPPGS
jgi:hypothetical protein